MTALPNPHSVYPTPHSSRRRWLKQFGCGFGTLAPRPYHVVNGLVCPHQVVGILFSCVLCTLLVSPLVLADDRPATTFFAKHCIECHGPETAEGRLRLDQLPADFDGKHFGHWERVFVVLSENKMPPKDEPRPSATESKEIQQWILKGFKSRPGRKSLRLLTAREIDFAINELFGFDPPLDIQSRLSAATVLGGFDNAGEDAAMSPTSLATLLETVRYALDHALVEGARPQTHQIAVEANEMEGWRDMRKRVDEVERKRAGAIEQAEKDKMAGKTPRPLPPQVRGPSKGIEITRQEGYEDATGFGAHRPGQDDKTAVLYPFVAAPMYRLISSTIEPKNAARFNVAHFSETQVSPPPEGVLRITVRAGATVPDGKSPPRLLAHLGVRTLPNDGEVSYGTSATVTVEAPADQPQSYTFKLRYFYRPKDAELLERKRKNSREDIFVRDGHWALMRVSLANQWEMEEVSLGAAIPQVDFSRLGDRQYKENRPQLHAHEIDWEGLPQVVIHNAEVEVPYYASWPPPSHIALLGNEDEELDERARARRAIERVMTRVIRRPPADAEIEPYLLHFVAERAAGRSFVAAVKEALAGVLVSPGFLYLNQPRDVAQGAQYELAGHLAAFLWGGLPDEQLMGLAGTGKLSDRQTLAAQVDRMLNDSRARRFTDDFTRQWLAIPHLDRNTLPDVEVAYGDQLRASILQEPARFLDELLRTDESLLCLIDCDFAVVDDRLAEFYDIPVGRVSRPDHLADSNFGSGLETRPTTDFRRVRLGPESAHRGGLLTQSAVMIAMTRGAAENRWPIFRGAWIVRHFLRENLPEPPLEVPELDRVEALTVREQITLHQEHRSCALCHAAMDPVGYGLMAFDNVGRPRSRQIGWEIPPPANDNRKQSQQGTPVEARVALDTAGKLPRGHAFDDFKSMQALLLREYRRDVMKRFTEKVLAYALRRRLDPSDGPAVDALIAQGEKDGFKARTYLKTIITSELFALDR